VNSYVSRIVGIICGLLLATGCATPNPVSGSPTRQSAAAPQTATAEEQIWVLDSGWHTGLILSRTELGASLAGLLQPPENARYFMFGWGNRKFYMAPEPTLGMDMAALFPSPSVVLVETCTTPPRACYTSAVKFLSVSVTRSGLDRLDGYLADALQTDAHGRLVPLAAGPDAGSEFYASGLSYDAFHTCNTWTAKALHTAGLPVDYHGVIFADQLWRQLK
jgi:uncharacterized protein (TIGR02117 family)